MYYAIFNAEGRPVAFYTQDVNGDNVPTDAVPITEGQWLEFINNEGYRKWDGSKVVAYEPPPVPAPVPQRASKLGLKRALGEIDRWVEVRSLINADPEIAEDWDLAVEIQRDDPMFLVFVSSGQFTPKEIDDVFIRANEVVTIV